MTRSSQLTHLIRWGACAFFIMLLHAAGFPAAWSPMPMDEIRSIYESRTLTDEERILALVRQLDDRITLNIHGTGAPDHDQNGYEYATLIALIAKPVAANNTPEYAKIIETTMLQLKGVKNQDDNRLWQPAADSCREIQGDDVIQLITIVTGSTTSDTKKEILSTILAYSNDLASTQEILTNTRKNNRLSEAEQQRVLTIAENWLGTY